MVCGQPSESKKDKCYFLISGSENITINEDGNITEKSICEKLLGVNVDYKLKLNEHLENILKKASRNVNAFLRILPYKNLEKSSIFMNLFFTIALSYGCFTAVK